MAGLNTELVGGRCCAALEPTPHGLAWSKGRQAFTIVWLVLVSLLGVGHTQGTTEGTMTWGLHFSIAPTFFDPAESTGLATPFLFLYAIHDALLKPMPEGLLTPSLAASWTESPDGLVYDFTLRQGVTFHNGDPVTASDVVFSFQRYKGAGKTVLQEKVSGVEALEAHRVRFQLREPWPDFLLFRSAGARLENYVASWGEFAYGGYPDLDALFQKQARELNSSHREELLHELQRLVHERVMFVPMYESAGLTGVGPRVAEPALGLISPYQWSGPYEEVRLKP
jgi:ABC-type transport system substrate-binding protein